MCDLDRSASLGLQVGEYSLKILLNQNLKYSFINALDILYLSYACIQGEYWNIPVS